MDENQILVEDNKDFSKMTVRYFKDIFSQITNYNDFEDLSCITNVIDEEINNLLVELPSKEEIKDNLFTMDTESAPELNGYSIKFF